MTDGIPIEMDEIDNLDRMWHLRQASLMNGLDDDNIEEIAGVCEDRFFCRNDSIYEISDPATHLYILFRGCVRSSVGSRTGREKIVGFFKVGDLFGENILGPNPRHHSQAIAHEECWLGTVERHDFLKLLTVRPRLALNFIQVLSQKLSDAREDIESLSFLGTEQRLARTLLKLGQTHGKRIVTQESVRKLKFPLSHEHLARLIGANRPHVSTIMSEFKKKGWIHYQGRKLLINMHQLANVLAG